MKRMTATVERQKWVITELKNGKFSVKTTSTLGKTWKESGMTFQEAGLWVWNMADNHDIAREINHRMCKKFNRVFFT